MSVAQTEAQSGKEESKNAVVVREIEELRGSNSKTYLLSDGSRQLELYGENIRFWQDGRYVDYDTTLKKTIK